MATDQSFVVVLKGLIIKKGKLLLIKRSDQDDVVGGTWECTGGKLEFGETLEAALVREIKEEVGLVITPEELAYFL